MTTSHQQDECHENVEGGQTAGEAREDGSVIQLHAKG